MILMHCVELLNKLGFKIFHRSGRKRMNMHMRKKVEPEKSTVWTNFMKHIENQHPEYGTDGVQTSVLSFSPRKTPCRNAWNFWQNVLRRKTWMSGATGKVCVDVRRVDKWFHTFWLVVIFFLLQKKKGFLISLLTFSLMELHFQHTKSIGVHRVYLGNL